MAARKKKQTKKKRTPRRFRFQLSLVEVAGIGVVFFCLFLWMFLLGIWAGQTILMPSAGGRLQPAETGHNNVKHGIATRVIYPRATKKAVHR